MQEWIIAMLVISVMLILRDMAKTFFKGSEPKEEAAATIMESHPQREKIERYAEAFQRLADTFYGMPYRKEYFSQGQIERILENVNESICSRCYQREICWHEYAKEMYQYAEAMVRSMEEGDEAEYMRLRGEWLGICNKYSQYTESLKEEFQKEKQNLFWSNRMIENRLAVAQQLTEMAKIMRSVTEDIYDITKGSEPLQSELTKQLRKKRVQVKEIWVMDRVEGHRQIFLNMRAKNGSCVSVLEISKVLSELCNCAMTTASGSRSIINSEYHTVHFVEEVSYQVMYGVSKITREGEKVSGDNFLCRQEDDGKFIMCLSDGMGSGREACAESENVVELLEQFLDSGFGQEAAARMINSAMVQNGCDGMFSTLDLCAIDLYTGISSFLKAGAAATFVKRDHWVEVITSESLAAGLVQQMDFDIVSKKLYHGDFVILMSDGVLDALPMAREEETMKEIIMELSQRSPKEISRGILERVLGYSDYRAKDDMTILVAAVWKK